MANLSALLNDKATTEIYTLSLHDALPILSVVLSLVWFRIPWPQQAFVSWAGLRGAVPIVLATFPLTADVPGAVLIFDTVFVLVVVFTVLQGTSLPWVARRLGIAAPVTQIGRAHV